MKLRPFVAAILFCSSAITLPAVAAPMAGLAPHKALYNIRLVATHGGSQVLNISGQMEYEWRPVCDAWITDHKFELFYEYADSPGMKIKSDFSTYETMDGKEFNYTSRRYRDGEMYQEIRGNADTGAKGGHATYKMPEGIRYDLAAGTLFPTSHTLQLVKHAKAGDKIYAANVFDGSDEDGPIEINAVMSPYKKPASVREQNDKIDSSLLSGQSWNIRMAVFPEKQQEEESDYEMSLRFHENGIISDMLIDYDDFSVRQSLVSLEKLPVNPCNGNKKRP